MFYYYLYSYSKWLLYIFKKYINCCLITLSDFIDSILHVKKLEIRHRNFEEPLPFCTYLRLYWFVNELFGLILKKIKLFDFLDKTFLLKRFFLFQDQYDNLSLHTLKGIDFLEKYGQFMKDRATIECEYASKLR